MVSIEIVRQFLIFARRRMDTVALTITIVKAMTFLCEYPVLSKCISEKHTPCSSLTVYSTSLLMCSAVACFSVGKQSIVPKAIIVYDIKLFYRLFYIAILVILIIAILVILIIIVRRGKKEAE